MGEGVQRRASIRNTILQKLGKTGAVCESRPEVGRRH